MEAATPQPRKDDSRPKHQHWVPQFYLRYFATPETRGTKTPRVWLFSKDDADGEEQLVHVKKVCGQRYLYSPIDEGGARNWDVDDSIGEVESSLAQVWPALADDFVSLEGEAIRKGVALFVAVMHHRHPTVREQGKRIHKQFVEFFEKAPKRADGTPNISHAEVDGVLQEFDTSDWHSYRAWGENDHDRFFVERLRADTGAMAKQLLSKRWSVVFTNEDAFITSDKPVSLFHPERKQPGYGTPGVSIHFPLSPRRLLIMDDLHHEPGNQYYPMKDPDPGVWNYGTWRGATRFMVTGRSIFDVLTEITSLEDRFGG